MKRFEIGPSLTCDLDRLVDTRLLVQANSGGGKSWCLRRLLEQTHGHVQHLVIDPEGEFATLRERFDYVLASKQGGDTVVDPRSAALLAERLLELKVSAILDIYELKHHDRIRFVRLFLDALVNARKELWHPALIILDEAHVYAPQQGEAESASAVIDMATRGRKRGFCLVPATQRLSKLHKDVAAECNNKLVGRTSLDVDMKRVADELGFTSKDQTHQLRDLAAGEFFAYGPAFDRPGISRVKVGPVGTTHPKAGARIAFVPPPPTSKITAMLPKLADLPAEAEQKVLTEKELRAEVAGLRGTIRTLEREIEAAKNRAPAGKPTPVLTDADRALLEALAAKVSDVKAALATPSHFPTDSLVSAVSSMLRNFEEDFKQEQEGQREAFIELFEKARVASLIEKLATVQPAPVASSQREVRTLGQLVAMPQRAAAPRRPPSDGPGDSSLSPGERAVLIAAAQFDGVTRDKLGILTGYKRSTRDAYIQRASQKGLLEINGAGLHITDEGMTALGDSYEPLPTGDELRAYWLSKLPQGEGQVLRVLAEAHPDAVPREQIDQATGFSRSTRDAYLQRLAARRLIEPVGRGAVKASQELFS